MQPIRRLEQAVLNETASSGRLFERVARVKAARVEFSTAVTIKGVAFLCNFWHQKLPRPEDLKYIINIFVWNKQNILKALTELQRHNQAKTNPRWWKKSTCWTHAVLDYVGFGTMQLRFTISAKLFHSVQFLTIRQSQRRIRSPSYKT